MIEEDILSLNIYMENVQLTLADMASMKSLLEAACNRGAFKAAEMSTVGGLYDKLSKFLDALKCDWRNDPNSMETPRRVAKAYVYDLWKGRYEKFTEITSFPSDGYDGIIIERNIPLTSMCSHHLE